MPEANCNKCKNKKQTFKSKEKAERK